MAMRVSSLATPVAQKSINFNTLLLQTAQYCDPSIIKKVMFCIWIEITNLPFSLVPDKTTVSSVGRAPGF